MTDPKEVCLHPLAAKVAAALRADGDQQFCLEETDFLRFAQSVQMVEPEQRDELAASLAGLLVKCQRVSVTHTQAAAAQLFILVVVLLGSEDAAKAVVEVAGGRLTSKLAAAIGAEVHRKPVGAGPKPKGAFSPLGLRLAH